MISSGNGARPSSSLARVIDNYRDAGNALTSLARSFDAWQQDVQIAPQDEDSGSVAEKTQPAAAGVVEVFCLGRFSLQLSGNPVPIPTSGRPLAILKYLAARAGKPTPRDMLLEALWPNATPDVSTNRLRVAIHALRRDLGSDAAHLVEHLDGCYAFSSNSPPQLDTELFERAWRSGVEAERAGDTQAAVEFLEVAESLYRGDFLEDDIYEDWTMVEREFLRDIFLNVLTKLAAFSMEIRDYSSCQDRCRQIIRHDLCNEEAYRILMEAHMGVGQPGRALQWYAICETNLRRELNIEPSERLVGLKTAISSNSARTGI